jgi:glutamyl-tRNA reductase
MQESFKVATISYKNAPLFLREKVVLDESQTKAFYKKLSTRLGLKEAFVISTCNRTEIYYKSDKIFTREIVKILAEEKGLNPNEILVYFEEILNSYNTLKYLFEVSIGVHSQIVGDQQIINQIKTAYQWAIASNMANSFLHKVLNTILITNKRVVQETGFKDGAASTTFVTLDLLDSFAQILKQPEILVLGLGEIGADMAKTLHEAGYENINLCNRTDAKAASLAKDLNCKFLKFNDLHQRLSDFTVIISSVKVENYIIDSPKYLSSNHITYIFDLSVPRSISPSLEKHPSVIVFGIDEIQRRKDEGLKAREAALPAINTIINEQILELEKWAREQPVVPIIHALKNALEEIKIEELDRISKKASQKELEVAEKVAAALIQKMIKQPIITLKDACHTSNPDLYITALKKLFKLE